MKMFVNLHYNVSMELVACNLVILNLIALMKLMNALNGQTFNLLDFVINLNVNIVLIVHQEWYVMKNITFASKLFARKVQNVNVDLNAMRRSIFQKNVQMILNVDIK